MTFFCTIRSARQGHGAWAEIDARACEETRAERDRLVAAFLDGCAKEFRFVRVPRSGE